MTDRVLRILEKMDARLDSVDITLVKQEANLDRHMRRTELLEDRAATIEKSLEPIKRAFNTARTGSKWVGGTLAILVALKELGVF